MLGKTLYHYHPAMPSTMVLLLWGPQPPPAPAAYSRQEVRVVLDSVLQLLQEGQVCGLPRTEALFILQGSTQSEGFTG